jgi:hypothetical protein
MFLANYANMLVMILKFMLVLGRLAKSHSIYIIEKKPWTKKSNKWSNECHKACLDVGLSH